MTAGTAWPRWMPPANLSTIRWGCVVVALPGRDNLIRAGGGMDAASSCARSASSSSLVVTLAEGPASVLARRCTRATSSSSSRRAWPRNLTCGVWDVPGVGATRGSDVGGVGATDG
jgi:hypothetical protein